MRQARETEFDSLRSIYADVIANIKKDPIEQILVMTYEFDDQQLLNLISARPLEEDFELRKNQLKYIADLNPIVFYDARKTREFNRLPHFLELVPVRTRPFSCYHSKAYLILTQKTVRLVLGSMNLTYSGLFQNREVFLDFFWDKDTASNHQILRDFTSLLRRHRGLISQAAAVDSLPLLLDELERRLAAWGNIDAGSRYTLIASEPGSPGMSQLARLWKGISPEAPKRLIAVSPFFDQGKQRLIDLLGREVGTPREMRLITDERCVAALSRQHFGTVAGKRVLNFIPTEISEAERVRIEQFNEGRSAQTLHIERKLHAKILILESATQCMVYMGSANFTCKAWNGENFELGVVSVVRGSASQLLHSITKGLGASVDDHYSRLPDTLLANEVADEEDYLEQPGYPEFIDRIVLHHDAATNTVWFELSGQDLAPLPMYDIKWGSLPLVVQGGCSQSIPVSEFYTRLVGGKNLTFSLRDSPDREFRIPFWHAPELVRRKDELVFPTSEDWLRFYLGIGQPSVRQPGEVMPGEPVPPDPSASIELNREDNIVIRMQRYLTLFGSVEKAFAERAHAAARMAAGEAKAAFIRKQIDEPLSIFAKILKREFEQQQKSRASRLEFCFKLGELLLFRKSCAKWVPELRGTHAALATLLHEADSGSDPGLTLYINHCIQRDCDG